MRKSITFVALVAVLALGGCSTTVESEPSATVTVTEVPTQQEEPSDDENSSETYFGPWTDKLLIVDGRWLVGDNADIPADGLMITPSEVFDCSWRVLDDQGNVIEEVVTTNPSGATVQLRDGDVFESSQCSVWEFYDLSTDSQLPDFDLGGESKDIGQPVGSGTYVVGEAIPSGSYSQVTRAGSLGPCEYSISEKRKGRYVEVLTFSTTNLGSRSPSNVVLDLENGNLFQTDGCGAWQRYEWVSE